MDDRWKRIVLTILLSVVLPRLIVHIGSKLRIRPSDTAAPPQQSLGTGTEATQPGETLPQQIQRITIPVLMSDDLVVQMDLEEYVRGVVLAEMPASFDPEALKAQAVAARTYSLRRLTLRDKHSEGAICIEPSCCQAWMSDEEYLQDRGDQKALAKITDAVEQTAAQVVTYDGKLAETTYFSCSGGRTESAEAVWDAQIPYLQAVDSPGEEWASVFSQEFYFTQEQFASLLGRSFSGKPAQWLGKVTKTEGNGVQSMVIGGITYSGVQLRKLLGLPSTVFSMTADEEGIYVSARGHGHRVGMSQYGADALAQMGYDYTDILLHYYQGVKIDKMEDMG